MQCGELAVTCVDTAPASAAAERCCTVHTQATVVLLRCPSGDDAGQNAQSMQLAHVAECGRGADARQTAVKVS